MGGPQDALDALDDDASPAHELRRGGLLGRYELLVPIAKGGMARLWAARQHGHRGFTKIVAIKTILPHLAREPEFERMFLDEARIAALVHHPNVCEIYELGDERGTLYLAMEWVPGDSLVHLLAAGGRGAEAERIDMHIAARIVADVCAGLHAAHELTDDEGRPLGVVHRDVSPHNILVTGDGHVKVADFGVAKALGQMHSATVAGQIKGKLAYMAPEQVTGAAVDRRSDVFALGCVLYELCLGNTPFHGEADPQIMHALLKGEYTAPSRLMPGFPQELEAIIVRALATMPSSRFQTADAMKQALEQWLATSGPLVAASHVGALVRQRLGDVLDRRRDKIRAAQAAVAATPAPAVAARHESSPGGGGGPRGDSGARVVSAVSGTSATMRSSPPGPAAVGEGGVHVRSGSGSGVVAATPAPPPPPNYAGTPSMTPSAQLFTGSGASGTTGAGAAGGRLASLFGGSVDPTVARYVLAAGIGVAVALVLGIGLIVGWRATHRAPIEDDTVAASAAQGGGGAATAGAGGAGSPAAGGAGAAGANGANGTGSATAGTGAPGMATAAASVGVVNGAQTSELPLLVVKTTPPDAVLVVGGNRLAGHDVARPAPGSTLDVVVHADGFADTTVKVEATTTSPIEVKLARDASSTHETTTTHEHHRSVSSGTKSGATGLPANPY